MTLFTLLLVLALERTVKLKEHWQLDHYLMPLFPRLRSASLLQTLALLLVWMGMVWSILYSVQGLFFDVVLLLLWTVLGLLCIGAGITRQHYRAYLKAAHQGNIQAGDEMAEELALIHGLPVQGSSEERLRELQNALIWINYRYYLAPMFWFVVGGMWGPMTLAGYAFLRAYQTWLARQSSANRRLDSGIDEILHWLDWIPVRLVCIAYALFGHGEKALPAWWRSLLDRRTSQYFILTQIAQFSLSNDPQDDPIKTPRAAVTLARNVTMTILVVVAVLTIYGALF